MTSILTVSATADQVPENIGKDIVFMEVPVDISYQVGSTDFILKWTAFTANATSYIIRIDGFFVVSNRWESLIPIQYTPIDRFLGVGEYLIKIDIRNNRSRTLQHQVTVIP